MKTTIDLALNDKDMRSRIIDFLEQIIKGASSKIKAYLKVCNLDLTLSKIIKTVFYYSSLNSDFLIVLGLNHEGRFTMSNVYLVGYQYDFSFWNNISTSGFN